MPEDYTQTNLRLPKSLLVALKKSAAEEGKSVAQLMRELGENYVNAGAPERSGYENDPIWQVPEQAISTGESHLAEDIDNTVYGKKG